MCFFVVKGCCTPTWIAGGQKLQFELQQATTTSIWQLLGPLFLRPPAPEPPSGTQPRVGAGVHLGALQFGKSGASRCPRLGPHGPKINAPNAWEMSIWQLWGPFFLRPPAPEPPSGTQPRVGAGVHLGALQFGKSGASRCPRLGPHGPKMHQMPGKCQFGSFGARSFCSPLLLSPPVGPNHALVLGCTWGLCSLKKVVPHKKPFELSTDLFTVSGPSYGPSHGKQCTPFNPA